MKIKQEYQAAAVCAIPATVTSIIAIISIIVVGKMNADVVTQLRKETANKIVLVEKYEGELSEVYQYFGRIEENLRKSQLDIQVLESLNAVEEMKRFAHDPESLKELEATKKRLQDHQKQK